MTEERAAEVRCRKCARLLGRRLPDGTLEVLERDRRVVLVERGTVVCLRCGARVDFNAGQNAAA